MPWIRPVALEAATGFLEKQYAAALKRSGRIWNIVSIMSPNPMVLKTSMDFYGSVMKAREGLTRSQRELLAVVVSAENQCLY